MTTAEFDTVDKVAVALEAALRDGDPGRVFGASPQVEYRRLARVTHPDRNGGSIAAHEAFVALEALWRLCKAMLDAGVYGKASGRPVTVRTKDRAYTLLGRTGRSPVADVFLCSWDDQMGYAKVVRRPRDNDLMKAEARTLAAVRSGIDDRYAPFLPRFVDTVGIRQSGGVVLQANVFERTDGNWHTLQQVISRYPNGIDARDMAWMFRRLLAILAAAHAAGFVHGAVLPGSVMIEPEQHGLILTDWVFSVREGGKVPAVSSTHRAWYPPEVLAREPAGFGVDVALAARTMLALTTGGGATVSPALPRPLRAFFRACLLDSRSARPADAWALLTDFDFVLERTYGPRRFRPFTMKEKG